jgi:hypothetical protein
LCSSWKLVCSSLGYHPHFDNPAIVLSIPETVPVNVGEAKFAFKSKADCVAAGIGLFASLVLSTFDQSYHRFIPIPEMVPVKVGEIQRCCKFKRADCAAAKLVCFRIACIVSVSKSNHCFIDSKQFL